MYTSVYEYLSGVYNLSSTGGFVLAAIERENKRFTKGRKKERKEGKEGGREKKLWNDTRERFSA